VLATLVAVGLVGGLLAAVIHVSLPLLFSRFSTPGFRRVWGLDPNDRKFPVAPATLGLVALIAAYGEITLAPASLGTKQGQLYTALVITGSVWASALVWRLGRAILHHDVVESLAQGDPDYDFAFALAKKSGIRLREVRVGKYAIRDSRPVVAGVISLHIRERRDLTEQERQIILTERVAALKFTQSLTLTQGVFGAALILIAALTFLAMYLVNVSFFNLIALAGMALLAHIVDLIQEERFAAGQRKIDLFMLQSVGDFDIVERTVTAAYTERNRFETSTPRSLEPSKSHLERLRNLRSVAEEHGFVTPLAP